MKKWIQIMIVVCCLFITGCQSKATLKLKQDVFTYELGTKVSDEVRDYVNLQDEKELDKMTLTLDLPNDIKTGEYDAKVTYKNTEYPFKIKIEDTTAPELIGPEKIEIMQDEEFDLKTYFEVKDLNDVEDIQYDLSKFNFKEPGVYSVNVTVKDRAGNIAEKSVEITVTEKEGVETTVIEKEDKEEEKQEENEVNDDTNTVVNTPIEKPSQPNEDNKDVPEAPKQSLAADLGASKNTTQLLTVIGTGGSYADFALHEKQNGVWKEILSCDARVGVNGIGATTETSRTTPNGVFSLGMNFGLKSNPGATYGYTQVNEKHYWVDDVNSKYYNQFVDITKVTKDWNSAEHLTEFDGYYNYCVNINYNPSCIPNVGSAIFIHCDIGTVTYGCVAIPESDIITVMQRLQNDALIAIYPSYDSLY